MIIRTWRRIQQVVGGNRRLVARPDASAPAYSQILLSLKQRQRLPSAEMPEKLWGQLMQCIAMRVHFKSFEPGNLKFLNCLKNFATLGMK